MAGGVTLNLERCAVMDEHIEREDFLKRKCTLKAVHNLVKAYLDERPRVFMFVANAVKGDSRVIKTARVLESHGFQVVVVGNVNGGEWFQVGSLSGLFFVLAPRLRRSEARSWKEWTSFVAQQALSVAQAASWDIVYSHDMFGIQAGQLVTQEMRYNGMDAYWIHDVHEDVYGYDGVFGEGQIAEMKRLESDYILAPDLLVTVNESLRDTIIRRYAYDRKMHVVYNCPDTSLSEKEIVPLRQQLGLDDAALLGVYLGNSSPRRRLEAVIPLLKYRPDLHFALVTERDRAYINELIEKAESLGVRDRLHVHPYVLDDEVVRFVEGCDFGISLLTNYGNAENAVPTKMLEYLQADIPVIVSNNKLQKDFVQRNNVGSVVEEPDNVEELSNAVDAAIRSFSPAEELKSVYNWRTQFAPVLYSIQNREILAYRTPVSGPRIFQGPGNGAGQPGSLARSLRAHGHAATAVCFAPSQFNYRPDVLWLAPSAKGKAALANWCAAHFDILHYHATPIFRYIIDNKLMMPSLYDLLTAKAAGKTIVFSFRGGDARDHGRFSARSPYAWSKKEDYADFLPDPEKRAYVRMVCSCADLVTATDPELAEYIPGAHILPRSIDCGDWSFVGPVNRRRPVLVHAPSRPIVKGTRHVLDAVKELHGEGLDFEFRLVENTTHEEARIIYESSDIIIDQLRIGWYGNLSVEGMALGKTVVAYVRSDLLGFFGDSLPFVNANPDDLKDVLRKCILDPALRSEMGMRARAFCEKYHDHKNVTRILTDLYHLAECNKKQNHVSFGYACFNRFAADSYNRFVALTRKKTLVARIKSLAAKLKNIFMIFMKATYKTPRAVLKIFKIIK